MVRSIQRLSPHRLAHRVAKSARRFAFAPRVTVLTGIPVTRLGTAYGGWEFVDLPDLPGATILSCGLGEDASFDVEFAARYGATVIIVDPTPRAVAHFRAIESRIGMPALRPYTDDGGLSPESYPLEGLHAAQLVLVEAALAREAGTVRFFAPPNPEHVSHSIVNFQNRYSSDTPYIEVRAVSIDDLVALTGANIPLVKMDIEGAEIEVIPHLLDVGLRPTQLLVEFDELNFPSKRSRERFRSVHGRLIDAGYEIAFHDGRSNFLFVDPLRVRSQLF